MRVSWCLSRIDPESTVPLGIAPCQRYEAQRRAVHGCKLYLFSDGLLEASDPRGNHLG